MTSTPPGFDVNALPQTYQEYSRLCSQRGLEPQLDQQTFETSLADFRRQEAVLRPGEDAEKAAVIQEMLGRSEDDLLASLGVAAHLSELVNPGSTGVLTFDASQEK